MSRSLLLLLYGFVLWSLPRCYLSQECPVFAADTVESLSQHTSQCFESDLRYFARPQMAPFLANPAFNGTTAMYAPPQWYGHFLFYHNVALTKGGKTMITFGRDFDEMRPVLSKVRRYQECFGKNNDGRDVPTELDLNEDAMEPPFLDPTVGDDNKEEDSKYDENTGGDSHLDKKSENAKAKKADEKRNWDKCERIEDAITFIVTPCRMDNLFHLHNDVLIPTMVDLLESSALHAALSEGRKVQALILSGDARHRKKALPLLDVLYQMFDGNVHLMDDYFGSDDSAMTCFRTLIWGQNRNPAFYNHPGVWGRFDSFQSQMWFYHYFTTLAYGISHENHFGEEVIPHPFDHLIESQTTANSHKIVEDKSKSEGEVDAMQKRRRSKGRKPRVLWITRDSGKRRMGNLEDVLRYFEVKGFEVQSCCDDWSQTHPKLLSHSPLRAFTHVRQLLQLLQWCDVLIGLHGAGLAHIGYLPPGALLVELRVPYGMLWATNSNIAAHKGLGYFHADVRRFCNPLCNLPRAYTKAMIAQIRQRVDDERLNGPRLADKYLSGNPCAFEMPKRSDSEIVTAFNVSRCYHSQMKGERGPGWFQLFDHSDYLKVASKPSPGGYGVWLDPDNTV